MEPSIYSQDYLKEVFSLAKTIAIVGLSDNSDRPSYLVAAYLKQQGFRIIPVNPNATTILGEKSYASLLEIPVGVDIVDVFRKPQAVPEIVTQAIAVKAKVVWLQEGVVHEASAEKARQSGLKVIMDRCIMKEHRKILTEN